MVTNPALWADHCAKVRHLCPLPSPTTMARKGVFPCGSLWPALHHAQALLLFRVLRLCLGKHLHQSIEGLGFWKSMKINTSCKVVAISIHPHLFPLGPGFCQCLTALTGGAAAGVGAVGAGAPLAAGAGVLAAGMMQMSSQGAQLGPKSLGRKCGKNYEKL